MSQFLGGSDGIRLCFDHSLVAIESGMASIEQILSRWEFHPHNRLVRCQLIDELTNTRWLLQQHIFQISREDFDRTLEKDPQLDSRIRAVELCQSDLLQRFDDFFEQIEQVQSFMDLASGSGSGSEKHSDKGSGPEVAEGVDRIREVIQSFGAFHAELHRELENERNLIGLG